MRRQPVQGGYGSLNVELAVELGQQAEEIAENKTKEQHNQGHSPDKRTMEGSRIHPELRMKLHRQLLSPGIGLRADMS